MLRRRTEAADLDSWAGIDTLASQGSANAIPDPTPVFDALYTPSDMSVWAMTFLSKFSLDYLVVTVPYGIGKTGVTLPIA